MAKNGFSMSNRVAVESITATKTLTVDDCGKHFSVNTAGGAVVVTLPAIASAENGWNATFHVVSGSSTRHDFTVSSPAADVNLRAVILDANAEGSSTTSAVTSLVVGAAAQKSGDRIELVAVSDAYEAMALVSGSITTA
jgi:hypothetical protein